MRRIYKALCGGVFLAVLCGLLSPVGAVSTRASSAILMDAQSGRVLYEQDAHTPRMIASITKLMTALVALESGHDGAELVTIRPEWVGIEGSSLYLRAGETYRLETLLYGMLLHSGNDAAVAVAGYCGGSTETFAAQMNAMAQRLGMRNSHFTNPSGLTEAEHYSSAYDMALLAQACLKHPTLADMVSTKTITLEGKTFQNHNKLLWRYDGCIGMKTGYTEKAGRTLVSAAQRDGLTLICVTLNDPDDWQDHQALFDYGFASCTIQNPVQEGQRFGQLLVEGSLYPTCPVQAAEHLSVATWEGETVRLQVLLSQASLTAPVLEGTPVGEIVGWIGDTEVGRVTLTAAASLPSHAAVSQLSLWERLQELHTPE